MTTPWNLLVYAIAGNAKEHAEVLAAIEDMRSVLTSDDCNIVVQLMAKARTTRYWISTSDRTRTEVIDDFVDASRQGVLTGFLNAATKARPDASTALVLWAHASGLDHIHDLPEGDGDGLGGIAGVVRGGGGRPYNRVFGRAPAAEPWLSGHGTTPDRLAHGTRIDEPGRPERHGCSWGPDPNSGQHLSNVTMKKAIAASAREYVDVLGLNACWMATLEIEYELRNVATVEVASQVYAKPWPYRAIVASLSQRPLQSADDLARRIVASVKSQIEIGERKDTISAFRAGAAMDELATAFDDYARRVTPLIDKHWDAVRDAVMEKAQRIDDPHQVDLLSLTKVLGSHDRGAKAAAEAVRTQLMKMRVGHAAHRSHPGVNGLSILCPKSTRIDLADAYKGTEFRANSWAGFLNKFQRALARRGEPGTGD